LVFGLLSTRRMELLPVALPQSGTPMGPGGAGMLPAHGAAGAFAHAGLPAGQNQAGHIELAPGQISQTGGESKAGFATKGESNPEDDFSVVWLSALQMSEGQQAQGKAAGLPLLFTDPKEAGESGPVDAAPLGGEQPGKSASGTVLLPLFSAAGRVQPTAASMFIDRPPQANTTKAALLPASAQQTPEGESTAALTSAIPVEPNSDALPEVVAETENGLTEASKPNKTNKNGPFEPDPEPKEANETQPRGNVDDLPPEKTLKFTGNKDAHKNAVSPAAASNDLRTRAPQETPTAEPVQGDLPTIEAVTEEKPKPQPILAPAEESSKHLASPGFISPLPPYAREGHRTSNTAADPGTSQSTNQGNWAKGAVVLSEPAKQPSPAAGETAFEAVIRPKIAQEGLKSAPSNADAAQPARAGQHPAPANVSLRNLAATTQFREAEPVSESVPSQSQNLPAKGVDSYVPTVSGSQPSMTGAAPRPPAPAGSTPVAEIHAAEFETGPAKPAGEVTVQLRTEGRGTANIHFREQAGQVQVTVRAGDPQLVQSLRAGLDHLKTGLDTQGFQTTVFNSSSTAALRRGDAEGSSDTYHRAPEEPSTPDRGSRDQSGRGNQQAEEWMDEIE